MTGASKDKLPKNILLVKHTSLGDVIHALPAITDAVEAYPDIHIDWSINENFADVATWHPAIRTIITNNHRKWRKHLFHHIKNGDIKRFYKQLRQKRYDYVIDGQTNFKSALTTKLARSNNKCGYDKATCAESIAHLAYNKKYHIDTGGHAVERLRLLFANALNYPKPTSIPDFGIDSNQFIHPDFELPERYIIFIHNASWNTKLWPESYWIALAKKACDHHLAVILPSGNQEEYDRAQRIAKDFDNVQALPVIPLSQVAYIINQATGAVCVDTGLSHLAAALNVPAVTLYGATDSGLIGAVGSNQIHLQSTFHCAPCYLKKCQYADSPDYDLKPPCFKELNPELVWQKLTNLIKQQ